MPKVAYYVNPTYREICEQRREARVQAILTLVALGYTDEEIAKTLHFSHNTVKSWMKEIYLDLNVRNRAHAVYVAMQRGIIE